MLSTVLVSCPLVVAAPAKGLKNLKGRAVAFVGKTSTSGYLFPRAQMTAERSKALRKALSDLRRSKQAAAFFAAADIDGFVPAADRDYDLLAEQAAGSF